MRKITRQAFNAFMRGDHFKLDNTEVYCEAGGTMVMLLHGLPVAKREGSALWVTTSGYDTLTTKERINPILWVHGKRAYHTKRQLMVNDQPWDGSWLRVDA
jgi:hypothetical protein